MSELDDIRARRAAITPGVWSASWAWGKSGGVYNAWAEAPFTSGTCLEDVAPQAEADATFIAHAPADIDTLLAEVERLTQYGKMGEMFATQVGEQNEKIRALLDANAALTAERDALAAQLAQADDFGADCYEWGLDNKTWRPNFAEWLQWKREKA